MRECLKGRDYNIVIRVTDIGELVIFFTMYLLYHKRQKVLKVFEIKLHLGVFLAQQLVLQI